MHTFLLQILLCTMQNNSTLQSDAPTFHIQGKTCILFTPSTCFYPDNDHLHHAVSIVRTTEIFENFKTLKVGFVKTICMVYCFILGSRTCDAKDCSAEWQRMFRDSKEWNESVSSACQKMPKIPLFSGWFWQTLLHHLNVYVAFLNTPSS